MKATIRERVPGTRLADTVPPAYREAVVEDTRPDGVYTVLLFGHDRRDVVPSAPVRRALRRLGEPAPEGIIAVGAVFTEEALALLAEKGARPVTFHKTYWTDESAGQRQL